LVPGWTLKNSPPDAKPERWLQLIRKKIQMKRIIFLTIFSISYFLCLTQDLDSFLSQPQVLKLTVSTPQPRLGESFRIGLDFNHLRLNIFRSAVGKIELANDIGNDDSQEVIMNVKALKKGRNEIGPLEFTLDKTKYTTNVITYEVIDALPNTDKGLWFRKVRITDSTFCIIIEQRIPANSKMTTKDDKTITFTTEPVYRQFAKFKDYYSVEGLSGINSYAKTDFSKIVDENGADKSYMYIYSVDYFKIVDKAIKIKITEDKFENIPADFKFEEILIQ
jgi:hypothetical protein